MFIIGGQSLWSSVFRSFEKYIYKYTEPRLEDLFLFCRFQRTLCLFFFIIYRGTLQSQYMREILFFLPLYYLCIFFLKLYSTLSLRKYSLCSNASLKQCLEFKQDKEKKQQSNWPENGITNRIKLWTKMFSW